MWFGTEDLSPFFLLTPPQKLLSFTKIANVKNWHCCLKQRPREANIFHVLTLPTAWDRIVIFNVLFSIETRWKVILSYWHVAYDTMISEITQRQRLIPTIFSVFFKDFDALVLFDWVLYCFFMRVTHTSTASYWIIRYNDTCFGHAVGQLVEALRYKPEDRGFDSRWCHWNFSLT